MKVIILVWFGFLNRFAKSNKLFLFFSPEQNINYEKMKFFL